MVSGSLGNDKRHVHEDNGDETLAKQSMAGLRPGDVTWVRLRGTSWWPAQVVDEKAVSGGVKPRKTNGDKVLVRLYGTYTYSYVDPLTTNLEFDNVLKRHKGNHSDIIQKGLKQDFCEPQSGRYKARSSKDKGQRKMENGSAVKEITVPAKRASDKQEGERRKLRPNSPSSEVTLEESGGSARRLKIMQGLGLTAPSGSPFLRNGRVLSLVH